MNDYEVVIPSSLTQNVQTFQRKVAAPNFCMEDKAAVENSN
jgi:hypothetical protein